MYILISKAKYEILVGIQYPHMLQCYLSMKIMKWNFLFFSFVYVIKSSRFLLLFLYFLRFSVGTSLIPYGISVGNYYLLSFFFVISMHISFGWCLQRSTKTLYLDWVSNYIYSCKSRTYRPCVANACTVAGLTPRRAGCACSTPPNTGLLRPRMSPPPVEAPTLILLIDTIFLLS